MRESILRTLAYFDLFDYPLTSWETWKYCYRPSLPMDPGRFFLKLEQMRDQGVIEETQGFWFLRGRQETVRTRHERYKIAEQKYRRALRAARYLRLVPGVRMVAVANTLAFSHSRDESDIDLFVVSAPGALWKSRLLGVAPFALFRRRPSLRQTRDTFCFCFFASMSGLEFSSLALKPEDTYFAYWIASLTPVYDPEGLVDAIWDSNPWVKEILPNARPVHISARRRVAGFWPQKEKLDQRMGLMESFARALQFVRFPQEIRLQMNDGDGVIVTDEILKFHTSNERRGEYREKFLARCASLGV